LSYGIYDKNGRFIGNIDEPNPRYKETKDGRLYQDNPSGFSKDQFITNVKYLLRKERRKKEGKPNRDKGVY